MKYILVIDVPDNIKAKAWAIDIDGNIRFQDEDDVWLIYRELEEMEDLKPLPKERWHGDMEEIVWDGDTEQVYALGFNKCLHEITGETE